LILLDRECFPEHFANFKAEEPLPGILPVDGVIFVPLEEPMVSIAL
jgi:hypothetical protein